jgi:hypothetical protein
VQGIVTDATREPLSSIFRIPATTHPSFFAFSLTVFTVVAKWSGRRRLLRP